MAYRAALLHQDLVELDATGITADSYQPLLPPSLLKRSDNLGLVWRTLEGVSSASIFLDFGSLQSVGGLALLAYGGGSGVTFFIRESTTDPTCVVADARSTGLLTGRFDPVYRHFIWVDVFGNTLTRYLRLDISEAGATRLEAGGLLAGPLWTPEVSYELGFQVTYEDDDVVQLTRAGVRYVSERATRRRFQGRFPAVTRDEYDGELALLATRTRRRKPFAMILDKDSANLGRDTVVGALAVPPPLPNNLVNRFAWAADVVEIV